MVKKIMKVTVLGAGYMGSAITFPISDVGISVALWGTWLDDKIISDCKNNNPHPKLKKKLNKNVVPYLSNEFNEALNNSDLIIIAVSSEGFVPVFEKLIDSIDKKIPIITLTKGFVNYNGNFYRISEYANLRYKKRFGDKNLFSLSWGSVGGPVKAVELSNKIPTVTVIGSYDSTIHEIYMKIQTDYYRISHIDDWKGLEICSALKNVYAIAGGICDGVYEDKIPDQYHNFKSAIFMLSVNEMAFACKIVGGSEKTAYGLAGTGDLFVTMASGRNSIYGKRIGKGEDAEDAYNLMLNEDKLAEGFNTLKIGKYFFSNHGINIEREMPLFDILHRIVFKDKKYNGQLEKLIKNYSF